LDQLAFEQGEISTARERIVPSPPDAEPLDFMNEQEKIIKIIDQISGI